VSTIDKLGQVSAHESAMAWANVMDVLGLLLLPPAVVLVAWLAYRGAPRLALAGGVLAFLGYISLSAVTAGDALLTGAVDAPDRAAAVALVDAYWKTGPAVTLLTVYLLGHLLGLLLLGAALWRSRRVPTWVGAAVVALVPLEIAEQVLGNHGPGVVGYLLVAAAFAVCWQRLFAETS
jgi:hypothetical protein